MSKILKASVLIGGSVSNSFRTALGQTKDGLKQIGQTLAEVGSKSMKLTAFREMADVTKRAGYAWQAAKANADALAASAANLTGKIDAQRVALNKAEAEQKQAAQTHAFYREAVDRSAAELRASKAPTDAAREAHAKLKAELKTAGDAAKVAREKTAGYRRELAATEGEAKEQAAAQHQARAAVERTGAAFTRSRMTLAGLRTELRGAGIDTRNLAKEQARLAEAAARAERAQARLKRVQDALDANVSKRAALRGQMFDTVAAAAVVGAPIIAAAKFETAMLGVAKQVDGARDKSGRLTSVYFDMAKQVQKLGREVPIATNKIAEMVEAGARMGIARDDLIGFTKNTAMMATAFELPEAEIAGSMGKIAGIFKIPIKAIGEVGDAINFLDDNALSKGGDIIKVLQGDLAGAATTLGLSTKNAAALASTLLTLGESAERADTAASGMLRQLQIAKMNPKRFQVGIKMIGMSADELQNGMISDAQGTILKVLDKIRALPKSEQMEAVTRLFGKDWGGAIAKLAGGVGEYRRQLALANGEAAKGSMSREFQARMQSTGAQWQLMKNRAVELGVNIGSVLLPAVNSLFSAVGPVVSGVADWAREHPVLTKAIAGTVVALTGLRVATLAAGYAWTFVKAPFLHVAGFIARWRAGGAVAALGRFAGVAARAGGVLRTVGTIAAAIGGGPLALLAAGVTVVGLLVRKYWEPIAAWVTGFGEGIMQSVTPALQAMGEALSPLKPVWDAVAGAIGKAWDWLVKLLAPVTSTKAELAAATESGRTFGRVIGESIAFAIRVVSGVIGVFNTVRNVIVTVASAVIGYFAPANAFLRTVFAVGAYLAGAAIGFISTMVQRAAASVAAFFAPAVQWLQNAFNVARDTVVAALAPVRTMIASVAGAIREFFQPAIDWLAKAFDTVFGGIARKLGAMKGWLSGLIGGDSKAADPLAAFRSGMNTGAGAAAAKPAANVIPMPKPVAGARPTSAAPKKTASAAAPVVNIAVAKPAAAAPKQAPLPAAKPQAHRTAAASHTTHNTTVNIQQQPGESAEALANRVVAKIEQRQRTQNRGSLADRDVA